MKKLALAVGLSAVAAAAQAAPIYVAGTAPACGTCVFGTHFGAGANVAGNNPTSVAGVGGSGISSAGGAALDGSRTYIWDQGGWNNVDNSVTRGDADFAMMVWDVGTALDTVRLYTHQDHFFDPYGDFVAQDMMEYSVWGSNDNMTFVLLSDVIGFVAGANVMSPTYTFWGTEPSIIYRSGSAELGTINAYTRDYTFGTAYRYYGIRSSSISLDYCGALVQGVSGGPGCIDADPEIDAVAFNRGPIGVPEPASTALLGTGLALVALRLRRRA